MNIPLDLNATKGEHQAQKPKATKRHGACIPCKRSKTKCDGGMPCGACRTEKKAKTCEYNQKAQNLAAARAANQTKKRRRDGESVSSDVSAEQEDRDPRHNGRTELLSSITAVATESTDTIFQKMSLCGTVEEFARVKQMKNKARTDVEFLLTGWRELQSLVMENDMNNVTSSVSGPSALRVNVQSRQEGQSNVDVWKASLDELLQLVNSGHLRAAWEALPSLLAKIQGWEMYAQNTLLRGFRPDAHLSEQINLLCLELVDLDSTLGFFLGSQPRPSAWDKSTFLSRKIEFCKSQGNLVALKIEVLTTMQRILEVDTTDEAGVWEFLRFAHLFRQGEPVTPVERVATYKNGSETADREALKLRSNLILMVMNCRIASAAAFYSAQGRLVPPAGSGASDIIHDMGLQTQSKRSSYTKLVNKHAKLALQAFDRLCDIDAEQSARSWFRLHGALIAVTTLGIGHLSDKNIKSKAGDSYKKAKDATDNMEDVRAMLSRLRQRFLDLRVLNPSSPIFDKAIAILDACEPSRGSLVSANHRKTMVLKRSESNSTSADSTVHAEPPMSSSNHMPHSRRRQSTGSVTDSSSSAPKPVKRRRVGDTSDGVALSVAPTTAGSRGSQGPGVFVLSTMPEVHHTEAHPGFEDLTPYISSTNTSFTETTSQYPALEQNFETHHNPLVHGLMPFHDIRPPLIPPESYYIAHGYNEGLYADTSEPGHMIPHHFDATYFNSVNQQVSDQPRTAVYAQNPFSPPLPHSSRDPQLNNTPRAMVSPRQDDTYANTILRPPVISPQQEMASNSDMRPTYIPLSVTGRSQTLGPNMVISPGAQSHHEALSADATPYFPVVPAPGLLRRASEPWLPQQSDSSTHGYPVHPFGHLDYDQGNGHYPLPHQFGPNLVPGSMPQPLPNHQYPYQGVTSSL
ncbi:hypothetical protein LTS08_005377 [Lithohypha guttulata]|nr:hypothetical protein LTS08_005377 [Lithohypha guttulata]